MDTVANMLTTLINAQRLRRERIVIPHSGFNERLARFLQEKKYIAALRVQEGTKAKLIITLAYDGDIPAVSDVKRVSKPGSRRYVDHSDLPNSGGRPGIYVMSTSQGLMDHMEAREKGIGGEVICSIWK